jgi:hypothetical protein
VLYKALARAPQDRYENMDAFAIALRDLLVDVEIQESEEPSKETPTLVPGPTPAKKESSESVTRDALDATPVEEMDAAPKAKRGLPKWALWVGIGIISLVIISLAIGIGGNLVNMGKGGEGPLAMLATETTTATTTVTSTTTVTPTVMRTATPTKTVTITPTLIPEGYYLMPNFVNGKFTDFLYYIDSKEISYQIEVVQGDNVGLITSQDPEAGEIVNNESIIFLQVTGKILASLQVSNEENSKHNTTYYSLEVDQGDIIYVLASNQINTLGGGYGYNLDGLFYQSMIYPFIEDKTIEFWGTCYLPEVDLLAKYGDDPMRCTGYFTLYLIN